MLPHYLVKQTDFLGPFSTWTEKKKWKKRDPELNNAFRKAFAESGMQYAGFKSTPWWDLSSNNTRYLVNSKLSFAIMKHTHQTYLPSSLAFCHPSVTKMPNRDWRSCWLTPSSSLVPGRCQGWGYPSSQALDFQLGNRSFVNITSSMIMFSDLSNPRSNPSWSFWAIVCWERPRGFLSHWGHITAPIASDAPLWALFAIFQMLPSWFVA